MKPEQSGQKRNNRINKTLFPLPTPRSRETIMGPGGFEPPTSRLSAGRSTRLSYGPLHPPNIQANGFKALTLKRHRSQMGSHPHPQDTDGLDNPLLITPNPSPDPKTLQWIITRNTQPAHRIHRVSGGHPRPRAHLQSY